MSGDNLEARMDDLHDREGAMERHIEEKFREYAQAYKLDLSKHDDETWVSELTSVAAPAFFDGYNQRHEEQKEAYDVSVVRLSVENARLKQAVSMAITVANGREDEWGERAEQCFAILRQALESVKAN